MNNTIITATVVTDTQTVAKQVRSEVIQVDALYPNPTTGQFTVRLVKPLQNATVIIMDILGHIVSRREENGSILHYDLSKQSTGIYILKIDQGEQKVTMKIIKR